MSKYKDFILDINDDKNRIHFQEWIGNNIIFNGVIDKSTQKGVGRIFRLEEEIELDSKNKMDFINSIIRQRLEELNDR